MEICNSKNHLSRRIFFVGMLLFTMCLTMNMLLDGNHNLHELLEKMTVAETWTIPESVVANDESDNTSYFESLFLYNNDFYTETITKNICPIPIIAAISKGFHLSPFLLLFFFFDLFILLSDKWTLINQKIRLDI